MKARLKRITLAQRVQLARLQRELEAVKDYPTWRRLAAGHDQLSGADEWKLREDSELFDARQIRSRHRLLQDCCERGDTEELLFALNEGLHGNMGGMGRAGLYQRSLLGTKQLVEDYVALVNKAVIVVAEASESEIAFDDKLDFFRRASHCFGRSALALSGGSGLVYFHHGVVDTLLQENLLPKVVSGSSAGAWVCAQLGTRTDAELAGYFTSKRYEFMHSLSSMETLRLFNGQNRTVVESDRDDVIDAFVDNLTFQEAYEHTGRYINISIAPHERHQTSRLMNAIASPNVTIRSAVRASSSVPGMVAPVALEAKDSSGRIKAYLRNQRWVDGSFAEDLPFKRMSRLYGVNHHIVSMINPMAIPLLRSDAKASRDTVGSSIRTLWLQAAKESISTSRRWISPVLRSRSDALLGVVYRILDQDYSGDINIIMRSRDIRMRYMSFNFESDEEIAALVAAGQRMTWPMLDRIRIATSTSQAIDSILARLDQEAMAQPHVNHKTHLTI